VCGNHVVNKGILRNRWKFRADQAKNRRWERRHWADLDINSAYDSPIKSAYPSPSSSTHNNEYKDDELSINSAATADDVFYKDHRSTSNKSTPRTRLRTYTKEHCPLASEERLCLLGYSSSTVVDLEVRSRAAMRYTEGNGTNEGTFPAHVVLSDEDDDREEDADSNFKRSSSLRQGESVSTVNEAIRDDDSMGDKTPKGQVAFQPNGDSKTLSTLSLTNQECRPPEDGMKLPVDQTKVVKEEQSENAEFKGHYSHQFFAAFAANFGAVALGSVLAWTSPALPDLRERKTIGEISADEETWISAIALLGAASACPIVGLGIERYGRKRCLLLLTAPFLFGWLLITLAQNIWMIYVGRFLSGFCGGGGSIAIPVYVTESASPNIRGMLASGFDMMITVGILYIFLVGTFVSWEWQAVACGLIPIVFHLLMLLVPESPRYLVEQGKHSDASKALQWLRGASSSQQVETELEELTASVNESQSKSATWKDLLEKSSLKPTVLAVSLMVFQQLAAIDAVMFYTVDIFASSGADINENLSANIVGAIQVLATITAAMVVDRGGRRLLLLVSEFFMVISLGSMGLFFYLKKQNNDEAPENLLWLPLASLMVYVVAFSIGMGPLPWLLMGELLPPHIKGLASGIVTITRWILGFAVTFLFQWLMKAIGPHWCYWVFCGCCLIGGIFVLVFVPETKGKTLDEIQQSFGPSNKVSLKKHNDENSRNC
ncbi:Facilitated trehalose transporter Tret1, partial [Orchesella cincta]